MVKIALTYIIKDDTNKEQFEKSLQSFTPYFDKIYVAVTGTSRQHNEIHKLVKKYNGYSISTYPETHPQIYSKDGDGNWKFARFHEARNVSFGLVPEDKYDYIAWADHDDILIGGEEIRPMLETAKLNNIDLIYCTYFYSNKFDDKGNILNTVIFHERERFIKPKSGIWKSHLHEVFIPYKKDYRQHPYSRKPEEGKNLVWVHTANHDQSSQSLSRNIEILELQAKEEEYKDPRTLFYLAKTYYDLGPSRFDDVLKYIEMYIPMSGWDEEIGNAYEYKGQVLANRGDLNGATNAFREAVKYHPDSHTIYLRLIESYLNKNDMRRAEMYLKFLDTLGDVQSKATIGTPYQVQVLYCSIRWLIAQRKGEIDECLKWAEKRKELVPDDKLIEETVFMREAELLSKAILNMATFYLKNGKFTEVENLINNIPAYLESEQFVKSIVSKLPGKKHDDKSIVYFASFYNPHFEKWNGNALKTGIGGSESAVIYLSEEWVKMGYDVTVYCDTEEDIVINGVKYVKYWKVNFNDEFNIFISWRTPAFANFVRTRKHFLDLHDKIIHTNDYTTEVISKFDKVMFKSRDHATQILQLPMEKRVVISNGIVINE